MNDPEIVESLRKDFSIILPDKISMEELRQKLSDHINYLIIHDFNQLVNSLYRIDVSEGKLKLLLADNSGKDASLIIADLIIERQLQKLKARKSFTKGTDEIDEKDKW